MSTQEQTQNDIIEARKKFAEKFGNIKLGGKGKKSKKIIYRNTKEKENNSN